jgi:hypothetical protein
MYRTYRLRIQLPDKYNFYDTGSGTYPQKNTIIIEPPFGVHFNVQRDAASALNSANIDLYNIGETKRNILRKDKYAIKEKWAVGLDAGYDNSPLYTLFRGEVQQAYSEKSGTEWITRMECYDGLYALQNTYITGSVAKGGNIVDQIVGALNENGVTAGFMGENARRRSARGEVIDGYAADELERAVGDNYFIDNEELNIAQPGEFLTDFAFELTSENLLSPPKKRDTFLEISSVFFPRICVGRIIKVSSRHKRYNGEYKVLGFSHDVTISGAAAGEAKTSMTLMTPFAKIDTMSGIA